jgi:hypothetical protein
MHCNIIGGPFFCILVTSEHVCVHLLMIALVIMSVLFASLVQNGCSLWVSFLCFVVLYPDKFNKADSYGGWLFG